MGCRAPVFRAERAHSQADDTEPECPRIPLPRSVSTRGVGTCQLLVLTACRQAVVISSSVGIAMLVS